MADFHSRVADAVHTQTRGSDWRSFISVFANLVQTAKQQNASVLAMFGAPLTETMTKAQDLIYNNSS